MPTYDYQCNECGYEFELFQYMNDEPLKSCPKCKGPVERKIGAGAGLIFKGSGFYITDYRSDSYQKAAKAENSKSVTTSDAKKNTDAKSSGAKTAAEKKST